MNYCYTHILKQKEWGYLNNMKWELQLLYLYPNFILKNLNAIEKFKKSTNDAHLPGKLPSAATFTFLHLGAHTLTHTCRVLLG